MRERVTDKELKQFASLKKECEELQARLVEMRKRRPTLIDSVAGSSSRFPYTKHKMEVQGSVPERAEVDIYRELQSRQEKLHQQCRKIEKWLSQIEDSQIRRIIIKKYIEGKSWSRVGYEMSGSYATDAPRKQYERFMRMS